MRIHRLGQLLRPISRRILRQSSTTTTTTTATLTCHPRMFSTSSPVRKRKVSNNNNNDDDHNPSTLILDSVFGSGGHQGLPVASPGFEPKSFFKNWSKSALECTVSESGDKVLSNGRTLFTYMTQLIESPACIESLATLDHHQALEFKRRWIVYELDQGNAHAHLPLVEFFLRRGLKFLPPTKATDEASERVERIDTDAVRDALRESDVSGTWNVNTSVLEELKRETIEYPDLMTPDALLDPRDVVELPPSKDSPFHNRVVVRNHRSVFHNYAAESSSEDHDDLLAEDELSAAAEEGGSDQQQQDEMLGLLPVSTKYYKDLQQSILMRRAVIQQTGKGKIRRVAFMVLVGDGDGLVGYGEGKHAVGATALRAARLAAVRNMDYVERFERRTIWTEMATKLGSTRLILRPRPVGFGLRCNPHLHRILRAAGMKDVSAKVWGSRNKLNVMKAAFRLLHAGRAPVGMGDGLGGKGKKLTKGAGMRGKQDLERARGRKIVNLRK